MATLQPLLPGEPRQVGPHRLLGRLPDDRLGRVFLGRSPIDETVLIRLLDPDVIVESGGRVALSMRLLRARLVDSPQVARIVDVQLRDRDPYVVAEHIAGPALADVVRERGPLPAEALLELAISTADGLGAMHAIGLRYGDLTPALVLLGPDGARLTDVGLADGSESMLPDDPASPVPEGPLDTDGPSADLRAWARTVAFAGGRFPGTNAGPPELARALRTCLDADPARRTTASEILAILTSGAPSGTRPVPRPIDAVPRPTSPVTTGIPPAGTAPAGTAPASTAPASTAPAGTTPPGTGTQTTDLDPVPADPSPVAADFNPVAADLDPVAADLDPVAADPGPVAGPPVTLSSLLTRTGPSAARARAAVSVTVLPSRQAPDATSPEARTVILSPPFDGESTPTWGMPSPPPPPDAEPGPGPAGHGPRRRVLSLAGVALAGVVLGWALGAVPGVGTAGTSSGRADAAATGAAGSAPGAAAPGDPARAAASGLRSTAQEDAGDPALPPAPTPGATGCSAVYRVVEQWPGGFKGQITVMAGGRSLTGWRLRWRFTGDQSIDQWWNAAMAASGPSVVAQNAASNGTVPAHGTTSFVFLGTFRDANPAPAVTCSPG